MRHLGMTPEEIRVLGCLLEKQRTTPDAYPLSLNALRLACNQSTNRDPVVDYDESVIREALNRLQRRGMTRFTSSAGSRTAKYRHLLDEALPMDGAETSLMCVLMLRGSQTPGELKQRAERMHAFAELADVQATLERLIDRELVARHERRPGQKEERYAQLLRSDEAETEHLAAPAAPPSMSTAPGAPVAAAPIGTSAAPAPNALEDLERRVARLEREMAELRGAGESRALAPTGAGSLERETESFDE
jgi:uncharacterized protein YceH (UPF0502 family)